MTTLLGILAGVFALAMGIGMLICLCCIYVLVNFDKLDERGKELFRREDVLDQCFGCGAIMLWVCCVAFVICSICLGLALS